MPHVDDGILHAYLDGALDALSEAGELPDGMSGADVLAHLRACADCAARLEAERALREHAGIIVGHAVPATIEPPGLPAAPPRRRRAWIPLSWAASVLLAAGAGWWGSEILRSPEYAEVSESREAIGDAGPAAREGSPAESRDQVADGMSGAGDRPTSSMEAAAPEFAGQEAESRQASRAAPLSDAQVAAAPPPPPPPAAAPSAEGQRREAEAQRRQAEQQRTPPIDALTVRSMVPTDSSWRARAAGAALNLEQIIVTGSAGDAALDSALARERAGTLMFRDVASQDAALPDVALQDVARAGRDVVGAAWIVGNADVTEVSIADTGEGRLVRVTQRLEAGVPIDVLTWLPRSAMEVGVLEMTRAADRPAAQAADVAPSARPSRTFTIVPGSPRLLVDGRRELRLRAVDDPTWVLIRGDLGVAPLSALAARLAPLPR